QYSAARLPWAHQVACNPALEKAAFSGLSGRVVSFAISAALAGSTPMLAIRAAAPADAAAARKKSRPLGPRESNSALIVFPPCVRSKPLRPRLPAPAAVALAPFVRQ